ncbi:RagB/SusD family nutrient uptake outer membrane protein [Mucilaginibacter auburnensis]|uniref:Putative outer membrane starch-binding protein n=1 Tax=Mucilaginibacter auburnensis TaxID=1457233 RepID=A0A2H9VU06_9SPHI|nr:RagB/SusD family nutrient uptake outer membrane protein [Mucilaginibacter auburnensis]PJJ84310.1 putative outer membrane starch-binding protein [Mucilaginibacter auburnensis]
MKIFKKTAIVLAALAAIGTVSSCKKLLVEQPRTQLLPDYFKTGGGIIAGIIGVYADIRDYSGGESTLYWVGTDEGRQGSSGSSTAQLFDNYNGINSSNTPGFDGRWADINTLNGVLKFAPLANDITDSQKATYIAQAKFLRAWLYFQLVQTYGGTTATEKSGIPLNIEFIEAPRSSEAPAPLADIYNQIIKDFTESISGLPNTITSDNPFSGAGAGKTATAAVAKTYLAKAYLTRGYLTEIAQPADFQKAADLSAEVIANKGVYGLDLWQSYADAYKIENDYGKENMFNIDYGLGGSDENYTRYQQQGDGGWGINFLYVVWRWDYIANAGIDNNNNIDAVPQTVSTSKQPMRRDNYNGRPYARVAPNGPYLYGTLWPAGQIKDSRFDATFQTFWIYNKPLYPAAGSVAPGLTSAEVAAGKTGAGSKGALIPTSNFSETAYNIPVDGDTAVLITDRDVTMARRDAFKGLIVEPNQINNLRWPTVKKFDDTRRTRLNDKSARPIIMLRFSELYLINAEANYMLGKTTEAANSLNVLRTRAAYRNPSDGDRIPKHAFRVTAANMAAANAANIAANQLSASELAQLAVAYNKTPGTALNGLDLILDEYSRELFGDQRRWYDLVRTRYLVRRVKMYKGATAPSSVDAVQDFHMRRPIPQSLIDAVLTGPKYPQNNGY